MNTPLHDPARDLRQLRTWDIPWSEISHLYGQSEREVRRWHNEGVPARATVLPRPAILDWETVFVVSDMQFPTTDRALVETSQQIMADVKPDRMLFNGDTLDFPQLSSYKHVKVKLKSARGDIEDLHTDIMPGYLDTLPYGRVNRPSLVTSGAAGDATHIWMDGNHEQRYERYVDHNAGDLGMVLSPRDFLALDPSMVYYQYEPRTGADLSGLMVSHGWRATKYTAANTMADVDSSVLVAHTHRVGMFAKTVKDGIHYSYEMGHMCDEATVPKAVPGRQNWQQVAGAIVTLHRTIPGLHTVDLLPVLGGETVVWGSREYKIDR